MKHSTTSLSLPTSAEISKWLAVWSKNEDYFHTVATMKLLFETFLTNENFDEVLAKVSALDKLYSTSVYYPHAFARHICSIADIDARLSRGDLSIVDEIARTPVVTRSGENKIVSYYSAATKFCAFSNPAAYSIYDSYVEKVLCAFNRIDPFFDEKSLDFRAYQDYDTILNCFRKKYHSVFAEVSRIDMDKYLWALGKTTFPRYPSPSHTQS